MLTLQTASNEKQKENMRKLKEQEAELLVSTVQSCRMSCFLLSFVSTYIIVGMFVYITLGH